MMERHGILGLVCDLIEASTPWRATWVVTWRGPIIDVWGLENSATGYAHFVSAVFPFWEILRSMGLGGAVIMHHYEEVGDER